MSNGSPVVKTTQDTRTRRANVPWPHIMPEKETGVVFDVMMESEYIWVERLA